MGLLQGAVSAYLGSITSSFWHKIGLTSSTLRMQFSSAAALSFSVCSAASRFLFPRRWSGPFTETVFEASRHMFHVPHAASADCTTALCFLRPVVFPHGLAGVAATGALFLLEVI